MRHSLTRRSLFRFLGLAASSAWIPAASAKAPLELFRCHVAGLPYYDFHRVRAALRPGEELTLRRESRNRHDPRAIAVFAHGGAKLGYVPRINNAAPASLMDAGREMCAAIVGSAEPRDSLLWIAVSLTE